MKTLFFDSDVAIEVGVDEAILYQNISYWCEHNRANGTHFHDGLHWTYNSAEAFVELFPFWNRKKIDRMILSLEKAGYIKIGNYNTKSYDRTRWFADLKGTKKTVGQNGASPLAKMGQPIPDNKLTDTTSNIVELTEIDKEYNSLVDYINEKTGRSFRKVDSIKKKFTARRKQGYEMQTFFTAVDVSTSKDYHQKNGFQYITPEFICREDKLELYGTQVTRAKVELKSPNAKDEYKRILAIGWDKCSDEELEWARAYQHADDARVYKTLPTDERLPNKVGVRKTIAQLQYERDLG